MKRTCSLITSDSVLLSVACIGHQRHRFASSREKLFLCVFGFDGKNVAIHISACFLLHQR